MATTLGDITGYKRLYLQFRDSEGKLVSLTLDNPKNVDDEDYVDLEAQSEAIEAVMDIIIDKNIFHNKGTIRVSDKLQCWNVERF